MLSVLFSASDEAWLNSTNALLGIVTLICVLVVAFGIFHDVMERIRKRARARNHFVYDDHAMALPELGYTMADGGEPVDGSKEKK